MATIKTVFNKCGLLKNRATVLSYVQNNGMAQYPSYYIRPTFRKEEQEKLKETGEYYNLTHIPTRAALVDQTCSPSNDHLVNLFINYVMRDGLKTLARGLITETFENVKRFQLEKYHKCQNEEEKANIELNPRTVFHNAIENCKPVLNLTPIKRGGVKYQVPVPLNEKSAQFLSMKWLIAAAKEKDPNTRFHVQLARELIDASNNTGRVIKKKQDLHRQCEANRAYAHYRWS